MQNQNDRRIKEMLLLLQDMPSSSSWWPAPTEYEVLVGAVLTQNTRWENVKMSLIRLPHPLEPQAILALSEEELQDRIRPSGFYRQKSKTLRTLTTWYVALGSRSEAEKSDLGGLRTELLSMTGIGCETADSILNYGLHLPILVIDAYTRRICMRFGISVPRHYDEVRAQLEQNISPDTESLQKFHGKMVDLAKTHCLKRPSCSGCPLAKSCYRKGLDE